MRKIVALIVAAAVVMALILSGCGGSPKTEKAAVPAKDWNAVLSEARGTTVNFYGWGGDQRINKWLDEVVAPELKAKYGITLNRVGMNVDEILNKLMGEKQAGREQGTIDVVWINGENFYAAKKAKLLYGPFTTLLPNFNQFTNPDDPEIKSDFGHLIEGYEAPYGKAQLVLIYDSAKLSESELPKNYQSLLALAQKYPGKITYPAPPDFTGSAFVRNIICDVVGREKLNGLNSKDRKAVESVVAPAMDYLKELKPYLWKQGESYPATVAQLHNLFADGEVILSMDYAPYLAAGKAKTGEFPPTVKTFVLEKGTMGNTHYLAIPFNAPNKSGALAVINFLMSPQMQASKNDPVKWGDLPAIALNLLTPEDKKLFDSINLGQGALPSSVLQAHRVAEPDATLIPVIEDIWLKTVVKKGE